LNCHLIGFDGFILRPFVYIIHFIDTCIVKLLLWNYTAASVRTERKRRRMFFFFIGALLNTAVAVTHYSVPEELEEGSVVANLASDLDLDVKTLSRRKMRLDIISSKRYLDVNKETGELYIVERIDREYLCAIKTTTCFLKMEAIVENPQRIFYIEIEITDINDNAPHFRRDTINVDIMESTPAG
uniref:Cadherin domain-containing protein n=1 Tax=Stegastes partitus TaxID=144197 RepID=A0A3B4Z342_9TELE